MANEGIERQSIRERALIMTARPDLPCQWKLSLQVNGTVIEVFTNLKKEKHLQCYS